MGTYVEGYSEVQKHALVVGSRSPFFRKSRVWIRIRAMDPHSTTIVWIGNLPGLSLRPA